MENKVQLCGKYSTVMQIIIVVLGVKFLSLTAVTTDFKLNPLLTVKMSSFDTVHGALPWPRCACTTKASCHLNPGEFELQTFVFRHNSRPYHQKLVQLATYLLRFVYTVCLLWFELRLNLITIALHDSLLTFGN